jgi:type II secretory pathway component PulF
MKSVSLSSQERLNLISNLGTLISSGIPILEAVESLTSESKGNLAKVLKILKEDLNQGKSVADSLARSPRAFDPITVNLIKAAEEAGTLDATLKDLTETIKKDMDFVDKVKGALAYPALIVLVLFIVILINLFFVIPRVATVFIRLKIPLPLPTKILIATSTFLTHNTIYAACGFAVLVGVIIIIFKTRRQTLLNILFSLPGISKLIIEIDLTRFTRSLSLLLRSGIPITDSLELCTNIVLKKQVARIIGESQRLVNSGKNLSNGFEKSKIIPSFMIHVTQAGEKSGTLEKSMQELSEQFDTRVETRLKSLTTLIEPLLLLFVGLMVGAIMLAIIAPIYKLIGSISPTGQ